MQTKMMIFGLLAAVFLGLALGEEVVKKRGEFTKVSSTADLAGKVELFTSGDAEKVRTLEGFKKGDGSQLWVSEVEKPTDLTKAKKVADDITDGLVKYPMPTGASIATGNSVVLVKSDGSTIAAYAALSSAFAASISWLTALFALVSLTG